jgi:hypothetical protein
VRPPLAFRWTGRTARLIKSAKLLEHLGIQFPHRALVGRMILTSPTVLQDGPIGLLPFARKIA